MTGEAAPGLPFVDAGPDLALRGTEIQSDPRRLVGAHRLAQHREPGLRTRQPTGEPPPAPARVAAPVHGWLAIDRGARPHLGAIHGKHPHRIRVARMRHDGKTDVADVL